MSLLCWKSIIVIFQKSSERSERGKIYVFKSHKCQFRVKSRDSRTFPRNSRKNRNTRKGGENGTYIYLKARFINLLSNSA